MGGVPELRLRSRLNRGLDRVDQRLMLSHRVSALSGAAKAVDRPRRFVAEQVAFFPLRALAHVVSRMTNLTPAEAWARLTDRVGDVGHYGLRDGPGKITIRRGSVDVFVVYEVFASGLYEPPPEVCAILDSRVGPVRILDLGANVGLFSVSAKNRYPGAVVVAFEPDPQNIEVLRLAIEANEPDSWELVPACAATRDGVVRFMSGQFAESRVTDGSGDGVVEVPAQDVMPRMKLADLVKIDIEGSEWDILRDARLAESAPVLVVEYHEWSSPGDDPAAAALGLLEAAGYTTGIPVEDAPGFGVVWAWREP